VRWSFKRHFIPVLLYADVRLNRRDWMEAGHGFGFGLEGGKWHLEIK
jgi:hypothetical protein